MFEHIKKRKLDFGDITVEFHADYTEFLIKKYNLSANSIGRDIKSIKMIMNEAVERGLHKNLQHKSRRFSITKETVESIYLNHLELAEMQAVDLTGNKRQDRVRDLFIAAAFTGLRFSDISILKPEHIQDGFIKITQTKTDVEVVIPVHPVVSTIINKYQGLLPKAFSNEITNLLPKEIGQRCPHLQVTVSKTFTKGGTKVTKNSKKWELLSTHTARRSFATNEYLARTNTFTIMAVTGHKTEKAFMKYIKLTPTEHAQKMKDIWATRNQLKAI